MKPYILDYQTVDTLIAGGYKVLEAMMVRVTGNFSLPGSTSEPKIVSPAKNKLYCERRFIAFKASNNRHYVGDLKQDLIN